MNLRETIRAYFANDIVSFYRHFYPKLDSGQGSADVLCRFHDDHVPSMSVQLGGDKAGCWFCHACNVGGDIFDFYAKANNLSCNGAGFLQVMEAMSKEFGIQQGADGGKQHITATYDYKDEGGQLEYQILRMEPGKNGRGGWKWSKKGVRLLLYRLDELRPAKGCIVFVEGEKCVDALWGLEIAATTNPFGASKYRDEYSPMLQGRDVILWRDKDEPGARHMESVAQSLQGHASSVRLVNPPAELPERGDVFDGIQNLGWGRQDVLGFLHSAEVYEPAAEHEEKADLASGPYRIEDGRIGFMKKVGRGDDVAEVFVPLCNFTARVVEDRAVDNGLEVQRRFVIEGRLDDGRTLSKAEVPTGQFSTMKWVVDWWGVRARLSAGQGSADRLREAIQINSAGAQVNHCYAHTGWRKIDGKWRYLHAGLTDVLVALEKPLDHYSLPLEPEDAAAALRQSLALLEVAPLEITVPLLVVHYLAPVCEILHPDFVVFLVGKTGSMKSTLAALFLSHYGHFERTNLPASWESTDNALERRLFTLKDTVCVVDDYAPAADAYAQKRLAQRAQRIIRSMGNLSGRSRLRSDLSERPDYMPRGLMLSTGEDLPPGQSILARILSVEIEQEQLDLAKLTVAQQNAERLPHAMAGYLQWLEPQMDNLRKVLRPQWDEHRSRFSMSGVHLRIPEILAYLALGMDLFTSYCRDLEVLSEDEIKKLSDQAWAAMISIGRTHAKRVMEEDPAEVFLGTISAMMAEGAANLIQRDAMDETPNKIGWYDIDYGYLIPDAALHAVGRYLREAGGHFPHSARALYLYSALCKRGAIVTGRDGRTTVQVKINGKNRRVLQIPMGLLEPEEEEEE